MRAGRVEAARVPLPRGAARWCARARAPALFCGVGGLSTAAKMAAPHTAAPAGVSMSHVSPAGLRSHVSGLPAFHLAGGGSARRRLSNWLIQSKNLIAFRSSVLVEYPPRTQKRDD